MANLWLEARNIKVEYADHTVLDIDRLEIYEGSRIGLVGENGAGKSTLVRVLSGELLPDRGFVRRLTPVSVISQDDAGESFIARDLALASEFRAQEDREGLSGGEKTRRRIAGALSSAAHVLLADEPTTDLDWQGVVRLTKRLREWDGALLLVSHDRGLLDDLTDTIWEIEDGRVTAYPGNYSDYRREKENRREFERFEYEKYKDERMRLKKSMQGAKERSSQVKKAPKRMGNSEARLHKREATLSSAQIDKAKNSLASRLEHLEVKNRPREDAEIVMKLGSFDPVPARYVIQARGINLGFEGRELLKDADIIVPTGSRTALLGPNGCGKTTLMKRIADRGENVYIHPRAKLGIFGQDYAQSLDAYKTALENAMYGSVADESTVRTVLARLNMRGDSVKKKVGVLSGGERAKVAICKLLVSDANVLLLDEPTNHLDIFMLEALASMLEDYAGTILFVSHDRWFVSRVATRTVTFEGLALKTCETLA